MSGKIKIIVAFCLSILILLLIGSYTYKNANSLKGSADWVSHTQSVISEAQNILVKIQDIETAQRGYVITGEETYLKAYKAGLLNIDSLFSSANNLIHDNIEQQALLDSIQLTANLKIAFAKKVIELRTEEGFEPARLLVSKGLGERLMNKIRNLVQNFIQNENELLAIRLENSEQKFFNTIAIITISIITTILIIVSTLYFFLLDYNKRVRYERQLKEQKEQIRSLAVFQNTILDGTDYAIITTTSPEGIISTFNKGAEKMLGYKAEEIVGKTTPSILHEYSEIEHRSKELSKELNLEVPPGIDVFHIKSRLGYTTDINEWTYICKNGSRITVELSIATLRNAEADIIGYLGIAKDITESKKAKEAIIEAKEEAEKANLLKETFLANMSHEIRTPMNAIIGFTDLLLRRNLQNQEREFIQTIKNSGESLLRIINDVLDISKINSGMITFEEHPLSITEIFASLNIMLTQKAKEKNLLLSFDVAENIPGTVLGDPTRLTQIIINLVGNAIKFTKTGSVLVSAKLLKEEAQTCEVGFFVQDTGIGIPNDKLQTVFERFAQAETHTTRNYGGTGLGLSIAKQLVELQGGSIAVKSEVGSGTLFSFILPFKKIKHSHVPNRLKHRGFNIEDLKQLKILVVEDNPVNINFITSLFSEYDIHADISENGKDAVEKIKHKAYDIILMDIEMPEMNGYEATKMIRTELQNVVPIVAMSAHAMSGEKEKCILLGMNDYISKPIDVDILFEKMHTITSASKAIIANENSKQNKITNLTFLVKAMRGNKEAIAGSITIFLKQVPEDLASLNEAVDKADFLTIKQFSHRMQSTFSLMGGSRVQDILTEMETLGSRRNEIEKIIELNHSLNLLSDQAMQEMRIEKLNYNHS